MDYRFDDGYDAHRWVVSVVGGVDTVNLDEVGLVGVAVDANAVLAPAAPRNAKVVESNCGCYS